jgi:hypothetical protein
MCPIKRMGDSLTARTLAMDKRRDYCGIGGDRAVFHKLPSALACKMCFVAEQLCVL